jgi:hypothetical protein
VDDDDQPLRLVRGGEVAGKILARRLVIDVIGEHGSGREGQGGGKRDSHCGPSLPRFSK